MHNLDTTKVNLNFDECNKPIWIVFQISYLSVEKTTIEVSFGCDDPKKLEKHNNRSIRDAC